MVKLAVVPACVAVAGLTAPAAAFAPLSSFTPAVGATHRHAASRGMTMAANADHDILLRVARGEQAHRPPVWLMRQAGRYMKDFRAYSDKYAFRHRSETPEIAIELSLQPWRAFGVDGVIMFSDILTPFPAMGVEFDIVKGKGPAFASPVRTAADIAAMKILGEQVDIDAALPFVGQTLRALRKETEGGATLLGFVGAPWTLGAYAMEGSAPAEAGRAPHMRAMMDADPRLFGEYMTKLAVSVGEYACYQAEQGAQVIQFFESWAHRMTVADFEKWGRPYAEMSMNMVRERHPGVPVIYFANGGSAYLESMRGMKCNMIGLDQHVLIDDARRRLGADVPVSGNVDPDVLLESDDAIRAAVQDCVARAGPRGHILNLGHGVMQQTPEAAVAAFVDAAKQTRYAESALSV